MAPRAPAGSLFAIKANVDAKKSATSKPPSSRVRESQKALVNTPPSDDDSTSSSGPHDSSSESGSDSDREADRAKLLASKLKKSSSSQNERSKGPTDAPKPDSSSKQSSNSDEESGSTSNEESDSDEDESEGSQGGAKLQDSKKVAAITDEKTSGDSSTSEEESSSEEASESEESSDEEESGVNQDESSSEEETEQSKKEMATVNKSVPKVNSVGTTKTTVADVAMKTTTDFSAQDFTIRRADQKNPGADIVNFLSKENLEGKQLWYFTAPASVDMSLIKEFDVDVAKAQAGGAFMSVNGEDYGAAMEPYGTNAQIKLLIPSKTGESYTPSTRGFDQSCRITQLAKLGANSAIQPTATSSYVPQPKPIRPQPNGLKVRFHPIGVPDGDMGNIGIDADSESDDDVEMTTPVSFSTASGASTLKRKLSGQEETKEPKSSQKSAKKSKRDKVDGTPEATLPKGRMPVSTTRKETPVLPPSQVRPKSVAPASSQPSASGETPSKKAKKDKSGKKSTTSAITGSEKIVSAIPLPNFPGRK